VQTFLTEANGGADAAMLMAEAISAGKARDVGRRQELDTRISYENFGG